MRRALLLLLAASLLAIGLAAPASARWSRWQAPTQSITDIVAASGEFDDNHRDYDTLLQALLLADSQGAGLVAALDDPDADLTTFAPNDRAFARLAADLGFGGGSEQATWDFLVDALIDVFGDAPTAIGVLTKVLTYHVAPENLSAIEVIFRQSPIPTLNPDGATIGGRWLRLEDNDPGLRDPYITWPFQVRATNGVVHTISRVLMPVSLTGIIAGG